MGYKAGNLEGTRKPFHVGTGADEASAQLQVDSTTRGFLPPRMTTAQRVAISTPAEGLMVFDTDFDAYYVYQAGTWQQLSGTHVGDLAYYVDGTSGSDANGGTGWADAKKTFAFIQDSAKVVPRVIAGNLTFYVRGVVCSVDNVRHTDLDEFIVSGTVTIQGEYTDVATGLAVNGYQDSTSNIAHHTYITTTGAGWTPGEHRGRYVHIGAGYYPILNNTTDTLTTYDLPDLAAVVTYAISTVSELRGALTSDPTTLVAYSQSAVGMQKCVLGELRVNAINFNFDRLLDNNNWLRFGVQSGNCTVVFMHVSLNAYLQMLENVKFAVVTYSYVDIDWDLLTMDPEVIWSLQNSVVYSSSRNGFGVVSATRASFYKSLITGQGIGLNCWYQNESSVVLQDCMFDDCGVGIQASGPTTLTGQTRFRGCDVAVLVASSVRTYASSTFLVDTTPVQLQMSDSDTATFAEIGTRVLANAAVGSSITVIDDMTSVMETPNEYDNTTSGLVATRYQTAIDELDANTDRAYVDEQRYGLVAPDTTTTIAFNPATYQFTLGSVGATWAYWRAGVRHVITGSKVATLAGTPPTAGTYFVYLDSTDGTLTADTNPWTLADTKVPVAIIPWDDTATPKHLGPADERHSCEIHRAFHREHHFADGAELVTGGTVSDYVVNEGAPAGDDDNTFSVAETVFYDEDRQVTCATLPDPSGAGGDCMTMTRTGASTYGWAWSDVPFVFTPAGYINWNNGGTATEGQSGKFYCTYLFATNFAGSGRFVNLLGRGEYATLSEAEGENLGLFDMTGFPVAESIVLYRFVWATDSTYTTKGKVRLAAEPTAIMRSFVALQNLAGDKPVRVLNDLQDVIIATPTVGQLLGYNGLQWVNQNPTTSGTGPGLEFYFDNTSVIAAGTENTNALVVLATTPTTDVEGTETVVVNNNTVVCKAYLTSAALGRTTIDGGAWDYHVWAGVSNSQNVTTLQASVYKVSPELVQTVTTTGTGTTRTCTASGGSFWVAGDANANPSLAGYVQTPKGLYQITAYTSATEITIATPTGYVNESTVAFSTWKYGFLVQTDDLNSVTPSYTEFSKVTVQAAISCLITDKLGMVVTGSTTRTSNTTITWTREGATRYSHVRSPMGATHEQLSTLLGGAANDHYHVTGAQATTLGGLTTVAQGDIAYASAANTWGLLNKSTTANQFMKNSGSSNNPAWASVNTTDLATTVTGVLKGNGTGVEVATAGTDYAGIGSANTFTGVNKFENAAGIEVGKDDSTNTAGVLKLWGAGANNFYTTFTAGTQSANATYVLPTAMPAVTGYVLSCTDAGVMSWAAVAAAGANTALSNLAAVAINTTLLPGANDGAGLGNGTYAFSDLFLASGGVINWANGDVTLTHATGILTFNAVKIGTGGETAPDVDPGGLCLNHGAGADTVLSVKSSDVAHPFTSFAQTDTYFELRKNVAVSGGSVIRSFTEATTAVEYRGYSVTASTGDFACVQLSANYTDGSTGVTTFSNNSNIVGFRNTTVMKHMFKGGGDAVFVGALTVGARVATTPPAGTIQWSGANFQGYTGAAWVDLDVQTAVPTTITVADTADTTCFVALFESATGDLGPKTDAALLYNAATGALSSTLFSANTITANTAFVPDANDGAALGTTSLQFSDLFLAEGGVINWDNGDATLTQVGNVLTLSGAGLVVADAAGIELGIDAATNTAGTIKLWSAGSNGYYSTFTTGTQSANAAYTLPTAPPASNGYVLSSTTAGVMSWAAAPTSTTLTVAAEASDTTCYPLFVTAATGDLGPKTRDSFMFDALNKRLSIGTTAGVDVGGTSLLYSLMVYGTDATPQFNGFVSEGGACPGRFSGFRHNGTYAAKTAVATTQNILAFNAYGWDGGATPTYVNAAAIAFAVDGTVAEDSVPGKIVFYTREVGNTVGPYDRMVIMNDGKVGIANNAPSALLAIGTNGIISGAIALLGSTSGTCTVQAAAVAGTWSLTLPANDGDSGQFLQTNGSGVTTWAAAPTASVPTTITVADTADTTCFVALFESATGDLGPKTDAALLYNANTGALSSTLFAANTITANTAFVPDANDGAALGTTALQFSDLFLAEGGVINWDNGDATLTQVGNMLTLAGADLTVDTLIANTAIRPDAVDGAALGDTTNQWSDLFLASGGVINWANGNVTLTHASATLTLAGATWVALGSPAVTGVKTLGYGAVYDIGTQSSAITMTLSNGQHQKVTLSGNCALTIVDTGNIGDGQWALEVIQNGTGGYNITSGTVSGGTVRTAGGTDPACTAAANSVDTFVIQKRGTVYTVSIAEKDLRTWA